MPASKGPFEARCADTERRAGHNFEFEQLSYEKPDLAARA
jgi:hypothetical protein